MLRCAEEFSFASGATRTLESAAQPCSIATAPTARITRPISFTCVMGTRSRERFVAFVFVTDLHDSRRVTQCGVSGLPRAAPADTLSRAPDRPQVHLCPRARTGCVRVVRAGRAATRRDRGRGRRYRVQAVRARSLLHPEGARAPRGRHAGGALLLGKRPGAPADTRGSAARTLSRPRASLLVVRDELVGGRSRGGDLALGSDVLLVLAHRRACRTGALVDRHARVGGRHRGDDGPAPDLWAADRCVQPEPGAPWHKIGS